MDLFNTYKNGLYKYLKKYLVVWSYVLKSTDVE